MKSFSSSILSDRNYSAETFAESASLNNIKESNEPMLYKLLQFDESFAEAEIDSTREFYMNLLKLANNECKEFDPAFNAIFNRYEAVVNAASLILDSANLYTDEYYDVYKDIRKAFDKASSNADDTITIVSDVITPISISYDVPLNSLKEFCKAGIESIENNNFNEWASTQKSIVSNICEYLSKCFGIETADNVNDLITNYANAFKFETSDVHVKNAINVANKAQNSIDSPNLYLASKDVNEYTCAKSFISTMKVNACDIDINSARNIVNIICDAIAAYTIIVSKCADISRKKRTELVQNIMASLKSFVNSNNSVHEAMEMFGDTITFDSIMADLDPEDFNPTEFMDLSKIAEHVMDMDVIEAKKYAMALEAKYLANGEYDKLHTVNEAFGQKVKEGVRKLIDAIKKIISKFTEMIMGNFAPEKKYLQKYKNAILNSKVDPTTPVTFYGDVLGGMDNLKKGNFKIPTTSYNEMVNSNKPTQFDSIDEFFKANVASFGITGFNRNTEVGLADDLKMFWGYKQENKEFKTTFGEINKRIADIYNFLMETAKEAGTLRRESRNIERTYNNYVQSAKNYAGDRKPEGQQTDKPEPKKESYYSFIYDKMINEADANIGEPQAAKTNDTNKNSNNGTSAEPKTNTKMTRGDTDREVKNTKDDEAKIVRNMEIYCKTCHAVIAARATGYEYVHKELMSIIRHIVKTQYGKNADIDYKKNTGTPVEGGEETNKKPANASER